MQIINKIKIVFLLVNFQGRIIKDLFYLKKKIMAVKLIQTS